LKALGRVWRKWRRLAREISGNWILDWIGLDWIGLDWVGLLVVVVIYFALLLRRDDEIEDTQRYSDLYQDSIEMV
jgi:hypothetical protein